MLTGVLQTPHTVACACGVAGELSELRLRLPPAFLPMESMGEEPGREAQAGPDRLSSPHPCCH